MKTAILTLPLWNNYGGILQAYALLTATRRIGFDSELLDVRRRPESFVKRNYKRFKLSVNLNVLRRDVPIYPNDTQKAQISVRTRHFVEQAIRPKTSVLYFDQLPSIVEDYECFIVGSDQVWRPNYVPSIGTYMLDFVPDDRTKVAYAASFGVGEWPLSDTDTEIARTELARFQKVSVREDSAVSLLRHTLGLEADLVCDPTLLLTQDDYVELAAAKADTVGQRGGVLVYMLDQSPEKTRLIEEVAGSLGREPISILPKAFDLGYAQEPSRYIYPDVEDWLKSFEQSDFVVTDSFHGCIFSILYNKPFIAVPNIVRGTTRFTSLLDGFGLADRMTFDVEGAREIVGQPIDWQSVNNIVSEKRAAGMAFLSDVMAEVV